MPYSSALPLSKKKIARCREVAASIGKQVAQLVHENSTVGTERAVLRLLGFNDALAHAGLQFPVANYIVDQLRRAGRLHEGALYWTANAILATGHQIPNLQEGIIKGEVDVGKLEAQPKEKVVKLASVLAEESYETLVRYRQSRAKLQKKQKDPLREKRPLKYVIVATGNIFEDVTQAKSAVLDGADIIAVIRSTAQSLIDYVPHGDDDRRLRRHLRDPG